MKQNAHNSLNWQEIVQSFKAVRENHELRQSEIVKNTGDFKGALLVDLKRACYPAITNYNSLFLRNEYGVSFDWLYCSVNVDIPKKDTNEKRVLDSKIIGYRLKVVRSEKGMTQKQFFECIRITRKNIGDYENVVCKPEIKIALKIKKALNKALDWIYFGNECIPPKGRINKNITPLPSMPLKQIKK
ncbi:MAG: transcriptional regulator [Candidatus Liberibacter europaeus]|uniref:Transcriptional regulator n=1 Tax=Candidatus Liberibacter europaeus TaxID=744859 RepID=A0A2T4VX47_9HYPH|nr:transcriptional regulator [Candidatus Liberibacter europaeus]PTL86355.1 MAG: transcriptional regulator [Candidatus Liberibacter europaeus]